MMNLSAIRVENLGKLYHIGKRARYVSLRDSISEAFRAPLLRLSHRMSGRGAVADDPELDGFIWALKNVYFEVKRGEVVGIIGRNGAGKSTLLKILSRITDPTEGVVDLYGRVGSLLEVGTGFHPELSGRDNIYLNGAILGMKKAEIFRKFDEIVEFAEVEKFIDTPAKHYSSGMYVRLAFAVAAHLEPEILMVDEVLAVGDAEFQKKCLGKMGEVAREGRTVLFVSHNMAAIEKLCGTALLLNQGRVEAQGDVREVIARYLSQSSSNEVIFHNKALKRACARQVGSEIEIVAEYEVEQPLSMPKLGFVISDYLGNPVCGSNPVLDSMDYLPDPRKAGTVRVMVKNPKLLNGAYRLSLWFGDGREDFFHEQDCLTFQVVNMAGKKLLSASTVGSIAPECDWYFD